MAKAVESTWTCDVEGCDATVVQYDDFGSLPDDWLEIEVPAVIDDTPPMYAHIAKHFCSILHAATYLMERQAARENQERTGYWKWIGVGSEKRLMPHDTLRQPPQPRGD